MTSVERIESNVAEEIGDALYIYSEERKEIHVLNKYARTVWEELCQPRTVEELARTLSRSFADPDGQISADLPILLEELSLKGLVRAVSLE